jgi:hypothetical protein
MVLALVAVLVAMGGTGYAALRVPRASVGTKQLKANSVTSPKVKDGSLRPRDFEGRRLPRGPKGPLGREGARGAAGPDGVQGEQGQPGFKGGEGRTGDTGPRGPGTLTFDGQFDRDGAFHNVAAVNGVSVDILCNPSPSKTVTLSVGPITVDAAFHGWGTSWDGNVFARKTPVSNAAMQVNGVDNEADLDVVAHGSASGGKYTEVHVSGLANQKCNYHAVVTPPTVQP